jgi:hypothetical protein
MAKEIAKGIQEAGGEAVMYQAAETLPEGVLAAMHAPPKDESVPVMDHSNIATLTEVGLVTFLDSCSSRRKRPSRRAHLQVATPHSPLA